MANSIGKAFLKLLLVITLMFQPVVLSYAMASMDHSHQPVTVSMPHHVMDDAGVQQSAHDDVNNSVSDDCCSSAACCPAATISSVEMTRSVPNRVFTLHYSSSWEVIDLPAEIKPPRL